MPVIVIVMAVAVAVVVVVRVPVVVAVAVIVRMPVVMVLSRGTAAEDADEHGGAYGGDEDSAGHPQPREHDLAREARRGSEQQAEDEHAAGVGERDGR
ncbi:MAG TPA: hypothetical protein VEV45_21560, partial [Streptosporangiaceae bacterium]|nr:hypothetical protein [Streptosporangiaceae bacterium]